MFTASSTLWLIPTKIERDLFLSLWVAKIGQPFPGSVHPAGFGSIAAAASTMHYLDTLNPQRVCLIGIAGTYCLDRFAPGTACFFSQVETDGVGAESLVQRPDSSAEHHQHPKVLRLLPSQLGLPQWEQSYGADFQATTVGEQLGLTTPTWDGESEQNMDAKLLTVGIASGSPGTVELRRSQFPAVVGEDMEGFGTAMSCHLKGVPCSILRGASNVVGDRDPSRWIIREAMSAVVAKLAPLVSS